MIFTSNEDAVLVFSYPYNFGPFGATTTLEPKFFTTPMTSTDLKFTLVDGNGFVAANETPGGPGFPATIGNISLNNLAAETTNKVTGSPIASSNAVVIRIAKSILTYNLPYEGVWTAILYYSGASAAAIPQYIRFTWGSVPSNTYLAIAGVWGGSPTPVTTSLTSIGTNVAGISAQTQPGPPNNLWFNAASANTNAIAANNNTSGLAVGQPLYTAITATNAAVTTDVASPKNLLHYVKSALDGNIPVPAILPSGPPPAPLVAPNMADQMALTYWMLSGLRRWFDVTTGRVYLDLSPLIVPTPTVYFQCWADVARTVPATTLAEVIVQDSWTIDP